MDRYFATAKSQKFVFNPDESDEQPIY